MTRFVLGRLVSLLPVLLVLSAVTFAIMRMIPGDPVEIMFGGEGDPAVVAAARVRLGLDRPLALQYLFWLARLGQGDLGRSIRTNQLVTQVIAERLPVTCELAALSVALVVVIALPLGIVAAIRRDSPVDVAASSLSLIGVTIPSFFLGILLIQVFALRLHWLPPLGYVPFLRAPLENLRLMILPAVTLAAGLAAVISRMVRGGLLEVLTQNYIVVARSKGLRESRVIRHHALRNALIPIATVLGLQIGALLGNTVLTETVFGLPGVGRLLVDSIFAREFAIVQGLVLLLAMVRVLSSLLVDIMYAVLDPRISFG
ncbi:MAG TPA: ABC transporter permease [bacterium]|nr:ABC transporter permease [bacterium]